MRIVSINVSKVREVTLSDGSSSGRTGIFKQPTSGPVRLETRGFAGDEQADRRHHGWPTQAAYAFSMQEYAYWNKTLGRTDLAYGLFGENLTVDGLDDEAICIGDIYTIGSARVQVTFPRVPCSTLAMAVNDKSFVKAFLARRRCGPYFSVLSSGAVAIGDSLVLESADPARLSLSEAMYLMHEAENATERWEAAARILALDTRWQTKFLAKAKEATPH
jgi:MOSC domain-containing protein YiiM